MSYARLNDFLADVMIVAFVTMFLLAFPFLANVAEPIEGPQIAFLVLTGAIAVISAVALIWRAWKGIGYDEFSNDPIP